MGVLNRRVAVAYRGVALRFHISVTCAMVHNCLNVETPVFFTLAERWQIVG